VTEGAIDCERTVSAGKRAPEVSQPCVAAFRYSSVLEPRQGPAILRRRPNAIALMGTEPYDSAAPRTFSQGFDVVAFVDHPHRLLFRTAGVMIPPSADRRNFRFREPGFRRGCRAKVVSRRKAAAIGQHHSIRPLAALGFSDSTGPYFAEAEPPTRDDSPHFNYGHSFTSFRSARDVFNQTPSSLHCLGGLRTDGASLFQHASIRNGPDRTIPAPLALLASHASDFQKLNCGRFNALYTALRQIPV
jgi:hypothetical protein